MSYAVVEAAISTVVQKVSGYSSSNVTRGDYLVLGSGQSKAVILQRGPSTREQIGFGASGQGAAFDNRWTTYLELFLPHTGELVSQKTSIDTEVDSLLAEIAKWPALDGTSNVLDTNVIGVGEPEHDPESGPWWQTTIELEVWEIETVTLSE